MNAWNTLFSLSAMAALAATCPADAFAQSEPSGLVNQQHCMFCHTIDKPFLAPSFRQIAERYRNEPGAAPMLERKLLEGGKAHWGNIPMPPSSERGGPLSPQDAHELVDWVLSQ